MNRPGTGLSSATEPDTAWEWKVHEPPYMFGENPLILEEGMTFTVEPGIYFIGRGGVRIEDNVAITQNGAETFSDLSRDLWVVGVNE